MLRVAGAATARAPRPVVTGLPVGGFTGSLAFRFDQAPDAGVGRVRAKTGTLGGVRSLAGDRDRPGRDADGLRARRRPDPRARHRSRPSRTSTTSPAPSAPAAAPADAVRPCAALGSTHGLDGRLGARGLPRGPGRRAPVPVVTAGEAAAAVAELRAAADRSTGLVREFTGLAAAERTAPVLVVDRQGWVRANTEAFAVMLGPLIDKLQEKKGAPDRAVAQAVGSRVTGGEVGLLLGFLASKVLGQFDPFHDPAGRLLLVAPNIVHVERELARRPVTTSGSGCASTRRPTGCSSPPSRGCATTSFGEIGALADTVDPGGLLDDGLKRVAEAVRGGGGSVIDVLSTPGAEGDPRPGHRRDVAAGGPRRRRHGRRRAAGHPERRRDPRAASTSAARASASSTGSCARRSAST